MSGSVKEAPAATLMSVEDMVRGLVRCAELRERDDSKGELWDDEARRALEAARARGWGHNKVGALT